MSAQGEREPATTDETTSEEQEPLLLDGEMSPLPQSQEASTPPPPPGAPARKRATIKTLATECIVAVLEFLRATDLAAVSEVDKTVFSQRRIKLAVAYQLNTLYPLLERQPSYGSSGGTPVKSGTSPSTSHSPSSSLSPSTAHGSYLHSYFLDQQQQQYQASSSSSSSSSSSFSSSSSPMGPGRLASPAAPLSALYPYIPGPNDEERFCASGLGIDVLYVREIKSIIAALASPQPLSGKMFWVSTSWVANAKKYYEALPLPDVSDHHGQGRRGSRPAGHRRSAKIRVRRGSDALPPWPQMNSDLTCAHGRLSLAKAPKGKRRLVSAAAWNLLRKFYPSGPAYPAATAECQLCSKETDTARQVQVEQRERELSRRVERVPARLLSLLARKSGVPTELLVRRRALFVESAEWGAGGGAGAGAAAGAVAGAGAAAGGGAAARGGMHSALTAAGGIAIARAAAAAATAGAGGGGGGVAASAPSASSACSPPPLSGGLSLLGPGGGLGAPESGRPPLARSRSGSFAPFQSPSSSDRLSAGALSSSDGEGEGGADSASECDYALSDDEAAFADIALALALEEEEEAAAAAAAGAGGGAGGQAAKTDGGGAGSPRDPDYPFPLVPGIYHLVPRAWMRKWRHYVKDPAASAVPLLDCTSLLCHSHGLCVVPPHLTEFLLGGPALRRSLLAGLGQYPGEIVEIVALEEWEALHEQLKSFADFSVRFSLSPEGDLAWNVGICQACDPFAYGNLTPSPTRKHGGGGNRGGGGGARG